VAVEQAFLVRPRFDLGRSENAAEVETLRSVSDAHGLLKCSTPRQTGRRTQRAKAHPARAADVPAHLAQAARLKDLSVSGEIAWWAIGKDR